MKNVMLGLKKEVSKQVMVGNSTSLTTLQTLNGMTTAAGTGWLEGVAAASQQNSVGGLSKATYQAQNWFNNFFDSAANVDLSHLDQLMIDCQIQPIR